MGWSPLTLELILYKSQISMQGSLQAPQNAGFMEKSPRTWSKSYLFKDMAPVLVYVRGEMDNKTGEMLLRNDIFNNG